VAAIKEIGDTVAKISEIASTVASAVEQRANSRAFPQPRSVAD